MNDQYLKAPDKSVWALFLVFVLGMLQAFYGDAWSMPGGLLLVASGIWAGVTIGRWAWSRYGANRDGGRRF